MSRYLGLAFLKNTTYISIVTTKSSKFAFATICFLTGFFLCEFITSFFLDEKLEK